MGIKEGEITFTLKKPLSYKFDGTDHEATEIVLKEPGMEHIKFYLRLKQMLMRASFELSKNTETPEELVGQVVKPFQDQVDDIESTSDEVYQMYSACIQCSESVDIFQFTLTFEKMCCTIARKGICMVDGRKLMTNSIWMNLAPDDAFEMALRWCSFFAMPSIEGEKTASVKQPELPTDRMEA